MYNWIHGLIDMFLQESWAKYGPDVLRRRRFFTCFRWVFKGEIERLNLHFFAATTPDPFIDIFPFPKNRFE